MEPCLPGARVRVERDLQRFVQGYHRGSRVPFWGHFRGSLKETIRGSIRTIKGSSLLRILFSVTYYVLGT